MHAGKGKPPPSFCTQAHPPTRGKSAPLFDATVQLSYWILFHSLRVSFLGVLRGGARQRRSARSDRDGELGPRRRLAAIQSLDLDLPQR